MINVDKMTVVEAFKQRQAEAIVLLETLTAMTSKMDADFDEITWANVGSLSNVVNNLEELVGV